MAMRVMLRRAHLEEKRDYTIVETRFNMKPFLIEGKADLIAPSPNFVDAERGLSRPLFTQKDAFGITQFTAWYARQPFIAKNRAALVDFLEDLLRVQRWFMDFGNYDEAVAIVANFTKRPPELYRSWLFTEHGDGYRDPDGIPDLKGVQRSIDLQHEFGYLKAPLDVTPYVDLSLVKTSARLAAALGGPLPWGRPRRSTPPMRILAETAQETVQCGAQLFSVRYSRRMSSRV